MHAAFYLVMVRLLSDAALLFTYIWFCGLSICDAVKAVIDRSFTDAIVHLGNVSTYIGCTHQACYNTHVPVQVEWSGGAMPRTPWAQERLNEYRFMVSASCSAYRDIR